MEPRRLGTLLDFLSQGKAGIQAGYGQGTGRAGGSRPFPVQAGGLPHIPHMPEGGKGGGKGGVPGIRLQHTGGMGSMGFIQVLPARRGN